jgi:hypothetical protein
LNTNTDSTSYIIAMVLFLFFAMICLVATYHNWKAPFHATIWLLNKKAAVKVTGKIIETKVVELISHSAKASTIGNTTVTASRYLPVITVEFDYSNIKHQSDLILNNEGYRSPEKAFDDIISIAPDQKIKFVQTWSKTIDSQYASLMQNIRVRDNVANGNFFSFYVNPNNPSENEYKYKGFSILEWLWGTGLFLCAMLLISFVLFLLKPVPLNTRIVSVIATFLISIIFYISLSIAIPLLLKKLNVQRSDYKAPPVFEVLIDNNYDGSQIEPYLLKPDTDGN